MSRMLALSARASKQTVRTSVRSFSSMSSDDYLHKSPIPTMHFQDSLLRLPIPKLEDTCAKYLRAVQPITSEDEFTKTKKIVQEFQAGEGQKLQEELLAWDKAHKHTSYISGIWFEKYLKARVPMPINYTPFIAMRPDDRIEFNEPVTRATTLIRAAVRFQKSLQENVLEPDMFHLNPAKTDNASFKKLLSWVPRPLACYPAYARMVFPLDMSQYKNLFASTRVPKHDCDELRAFPEARHVCVMYKGHFFTFDVVRPDGSGVPEPEIAANLRAILAKGDSMGYAKREESVGAMTTTNRDVWAATRANLEKDSVNAQTLKLIDSSLFTINFDSFAPEIPFDMNAPDAFEKGAKLSTHNLAGEAQNRWFDKSVQLLITGQGMASIAFEHSWGDGVAVLRFLNEIYKAGSQSNFKPGSEKGIAAQPNLLKWNLTSEDKKSIVKALEAHEKVAATLETNCFIYPHLSKSELKLKKVTPDGVVQAAMQLAYYRMYGKIVSTYEAASTAAFKHGRTECIRTATPEVVEFVKTFADSAFTSEQRMASLRKAVTVHGQLVKDAAMGKGIDRHMFILQHLAEMKGHHPALYTDPSYKRMKHDILSTSTLFSPAISLGGFGPVVHEGYGIGYVLDDERAGFNVTSFSMNTPKFIEHLHHALVDIKTALDTVKVEKK
eukprot:TRINITY_DN2230_c0_g1::TRINITY_DN2230_c0_g1_i1::g.6687::m.6687 TRINITY_DN2230_c0_g1::TRINITY_DN2230_c0_g1_i1::g.6687  ORF type:complete len:666 (-),score=253.86,sp/Q5U3U3/CPT2_DANRE/41.77/0.0,Carn_acyltransf/PF00755.15/1.6e-155 TRINITY_DN2230_c0_g1_i1:260-2257(-)